MKDLKSHLPTVLLSHANKIVYKILQSTFRQYIEQELPDRIQKRQGSKPTVTIQWIAEKRREF